MIQRRARKTSGYKVPAASHKLRRAIPEDVPIETWARENAIGRSTLFRLLSGKFKNVSRKIALKIERATDGAVRVEDWDL